MFLIHALNMHTRGETRVLLASSASSHRRSLIRSSAAADRSFGVCVDTLSHGADSDNKEQERPIQWEPWPSLHLVPCRYLRPDFLHFRNPTPSRAQIPVFTTDAFAPKETLGPLSWSATHFFDDLVLHSGSGEAANVQIHKRLDEQPGLVPDFRELPPVTLSSLSLRHASRRPPRHLLMTHFFSKRNPTHRTIPPRTTGPTPLF